MQLEQRTGILSRWRMASSATRLHTMLLEVTELTEHADNAIKFLSDMFSARLYKLAAAKVGVPDYKDLVTQKVNTAEELYRFMVDQFNQSRAFFLELTVVIILIIELIYLFKRPAVLTLGGPPPTGNLRAVDAVFVSVGDGVDDLVLEPLLGVCGGRLQRRHTIDDVDGEVEAVDLIQDGEFERGVDVALFLVSTHVDVVVIFSAIGELVDQCSVGVEVEDYGFVESEEAVELAV